MKTLAITTLLSLLSINSFAGDTYTICNDIKLEKDFKTVSLSLSKEGKLHSETDFRSYVSIQGSYDSIIIDGLKVEMQKEILVDSIKTEGYAMIGNFTTYSNVYGVKLKITANETIGSEIIGCVSREVSEVETYTICTEKRTIIHNRDL